MYAREEPANNSAIQHGRHEQWRCAGQVVRDQQMFTNHRYARRVRLPPMFCAMCGRKAKRMKATEAATEAACSETWEPQRANWQQ